MPEWKERLRRAFDSKGQVYDLDVLEELGTHAAAEYEACLSRGTSSGEAERRVENLIDVWVRGCSGTPSTPETPVCISEDISAPSAAGIMTFGGRIIPIFARGRPR